MNQFRFFFINSFGLCLALTLSMQFIFAQGTIDQDATRKTRNLYDNLHLISKHGFMFGHQDDQAYGVKWRNGKDRSDVKETTGAYPAVHGWDVGRTLAADKNIDEVSFTDMQRWIRKAYRMGCINTISWHLDNLSTDGNSWDTTPSVADILPGGIHHQKFLHQLDMLAQWLDDLGKIPLIFRPWHEHNGGWFWWGKGNCTEEEYIRLFRFTVDYLKNEKDIHHLLYAFSPDRSSLGMDSLRKENYLYGYPGDDYVDIIGLDNYGDVGRLGGPDTEEKQREYFLESLKLITRIANERGKVAALTETGLEGLTKADWFTEIILEPIRENKNEIRIAWVLVWRNANEKHHYAPYTGHASVRDFDKFKNDNLTFFEDDMRNPYKKNKALRKK